MNKLILYGKLNCHLCEEAYRILMSLAWDIPLEIDVVDITHTHNKHVEAKYFDRIPVIARPGAQTELDWPFTADDVKAYLARTAEIHSDL